MSRRCWTSRAAPGASATFSFDSPLPRRMIEITGTEATLSLSRTRTPSTAPLRMRRRSARRTGEDLPVTGTTAGRGIGVLDMARALRTRRRAPRLGELAQHVLDLMSAIAASAQGAAFQDVPAWTEKLEALPEGWDPLEATL